jgi:hypothetical protein
LKFAAAGWIRIIANSYRMMKHVSVSSGWAREACFDNRALADLKAYKMQRARGKAVVERLFESIEHLAMFPQMGPDAAKARLNGGA